MTDRSSSKSISSNAPVRVGPKGRTGLGIYLTLLTVFFVAMLMVGLAANSVEGSTDRHVNLLGALSEDTWLLMIVVAAGGIGSCVHATTSFATYVGNRQLTRNWVWWLLMRAPIGIALAVIFYLLARSGLFAGNGGADGITPYGYAAFAGLVGMFSKQATDKLAELFDTLLQSGKADERSEPLKIEINPKPAITSFNPESVEAGEVARQVVVRGEGFIEETVVMVDGEDRETVYEDTNTLTVILTEDDIKAPRTLKITAINPPPGGGESEVTDLVVTTNSARQSKAANETRTEQDPDNPRS